MMIIRGQNKDIIHKNAITLYDRYGNKGDTITASEKYEYLCANVDSHDRVFVGRIFLRSGRFRLSIYTTDGLSLIEKKTFNVIYLPDKETCAVRHYMVCLTPTLIAVGSMDKKLYFIQVPSE